MIKLENTLLKRYIELNKEIAIIQLDIDNNDTKNYIGNEGAYIELIETYLEKIERRRFFLREIDKILKL